jgi:peroxiredoxin
MVDPACQPERRRFLSGRARAARAAGVLAGLILGSILPGCQKQAGEPQPAPEAERAPAAPQPAAVAEPPVAPPRMMPYASTPETAFGTLPEGIGVPVGTVLPDVQASGADGRTVSLQALLKDKRALIVFYRGGWCPFCNFQIKALGDAHAELEKRKISVVAVSVDRPRESAKTAAGLAVPFTLLSDQTLRMHTAFQVLQGVDEDTLAALREKGMDLEAASGRRHHMIAVPALFLVDETGTVRFAHADRDYETRPDISLLLARIDAIWP